MWSVHALPLEKKIGQLFMIGFSGTTVPSELIEWIRQRSLGGVILFRRNIEKPEELSSLTTQLQQLALQTNEAIPLLIAVDQEGGRVSRLPPPFTQFPAPALLGKPQSIKLIQTAAKIMATELRAAGINMNFAPVLDVNTNKTNLVIGSRAFGSDPALVSQLGIAFIQQLQEEGIIATGKHFPGHGDTTLDSHFTLPVVSHPRQRINQIELLPFREAIEAGVGALMTAHVLYPALDPHYPATLSRVILQEILREELGFEGVIVTDDLLMRGILEHYSLEEAVILALQASADILLVSDDPVQQDVAYQAVRQAVQQGALSEEGLERSVKRIFALKSRFTPSLFSMSRIEELVHQEAHQGLIAEMRQLVEKE